MAIDDNDDRKDLTRIEDLSEFLHQEDPDVESKFTSFNGDSPLSEETKTDFGTVVDLNELDQLPALPDESENTEFQSEISSLSEIPSELPEEITEEYVDQSSDYSSIQNLTESEEAPTKTLEEISSDSVFSFDENESQPREDNESNGPNDENSNYLEDNSFEAISDLENDTYKDHSEEFKAIIPPEKFDDIKTFAQSFSYGQISVGGNPPFSVVIRNIKYEDDVESMLAILKELNVVNDKNFNETKYALEIGSLLIPQISEYAAIVIAHKLRRFDCDIELGLSDELHPPKNGDHNPRGLSKKDTLRQNHSQSYKKTDHESGHGEIIVSTTSHLEGFEIEKYLGIHSSIAIIDEEELDRLKFVQQTTRAHSPLFNIDTESEEQISTQQAFNDFQQSFDLIFLDLIDQLKQKAQLEHANALLALNYQINQLPIKKNEQNQIGFQLICTATLAQVKKI